MALVAGCSSLISGVEVGYEHYKGGYSNPIMYSPVLLSGALTLASFSGIFSRRLAETLLRWTAAITLADGIVGFCFHIRGVARKPGGWRLSITNVVMGPPLFAPLLFGTAAYLGLVASYLRPENSEPLTFVNPVRSPYSHGWRTDICQGMFQKQLCVVSALWAIFSGFEALYSHYKSRFQFRAQWTPVIMAPIQTAVCVAAIANEKVARTLLPAASIITAVDGAVGFAYHARGISRRPGGRKKWLYNVLYGPPVFAPLLFSACGMLGLLAAALRREK
jgi:hypothetical protein